MKRTNITVLVANLDINDQLNSNQLLIEAELPLISQDNVEGYDLRTLVNKAIVTYNLKTEFGIQVDYWSNSMQMYVVCEDLFSEDSEKERRLIVEEDLIYCEQRDDGYESKTCLLIRLKNCTGNIIRLDLERPNVNALEIA